MESNKSALTIIIIIIVLLILGILGYFMFSGNKDTETEENTTTDNTEYDYDYDYDTDTNTDNVSIAGSYSTDKDDNLVEDTEEIVTSKSDMELKLDSEGTAVIGMKDSILKGSYTYDASKITVVTTKDEDKESKTYEFIINDDDSLTYTTDDGTKKTLKKVDEDSLDFIKSTD